MSIINQALKKAQREQLLRETQGIRHLVHLPAPSHPRRWFLTTAGGAVALGAGVILYGWLTTAAGRTPIAARPQATAPQPTVAVPLTPTVPSLAMPAQQAGVPWLPIPTPAEPRLPLPLSGVWPPVDHPFMARGEDARPPPAVQPVTRGVLPGMSRSVAVFEAVPTGPEQPDYTSARTLFNRALASQAAGDQAHAVTLLQQAVGLDPTLKTAYNSLGNLYYQQQQYQQAVAMYQQALAIDPDYAKARNNLGNTYLRLAMDDRALVELQQALQADSTYGLAYYNLACVYARAGDSDAAAQYLQQAIALEPQARIWAHTDADFAQVRTTPVMQQLLGP